MSELDSGITRKQAAELGRLQEVLRIRYGVSNERSLADRYTAAMEPEKLTGEKALYKEMAEQVVHFADEFIMKNTWKEGRAISASRDRRMHFSELFHGNNEHAQRIQRTLRDGIPLSEIVHENDNMVNVLAVDLDQNIVELGNNPKFIKDVALAFGKGLGFYEDVKEFQTRPDRVELPEDPQRTWNFGIKHPNRPFSIRYHVNPATRCVNKFIIVGDPQRMPVSSAGSRAAQ